VTAGVEPARVADPQSGWFKVGGDRVRLHRNGKEAFPAMLEAIATAKREILLEMYWIGDDIVGHSFVAALTHAAKHGIDVKVVYDAIGSLSVGLDFFMSLLRAGGKVREYNSLSSWNIAAVENRDHRKLLVVDGDLAFLGGINLAREWAPIEVGGGGWRDDMLAVEGLAAAELRTLFYKTWKKVAKERGPDDLIPLQHSRSRPVWVLSSQRRRKRSIHREYVSRIRHAQRSIEIANPYFVPDRKVQGALAGAVSRGVRARVLVPETSDVPMVQYAQQALFEKLLSCGVEVYSMPGPMMHQKTAIIDDSWVTVGSYNLDERSLRKNLEVNVAIDDESFATHVRDLFDKDVAGARRVELVLWRQRGLVQRAAESVALALRRIF
jgi:cardiolipin synthase